MRWDLCGDTNQWTWMEVRHQLDGVEAHTPETWKGGEWLELRHWILWGGKGIGLRCNSFDPEGSDMWNGWMWDEYIVTQFGFEMRHELKLRMFGYVWRWCSTWMEVRLESWYHDAGQEGPLRWWNIYFYTLMCLRWDLDGAGEMQFRDLGGG